MGRRKKIVEEPFIPSKFQEDIFNFIKKEQGNLLIEACAGSGKTKTLTEIIKLLDKDKRILYCAFNRDIVKDITKKVKDFDNVEVRTIHSLGRAMIQNNFYDIQVENNENKYRTFLYTNIKSLSSINTFALSKRDYLRYIDNILKLFDYFRFNLCQTAKDCEKLQYKYGFDLIADEIDVILKLVAWGKENIGEIDYTDMIWLPNILNLKPYNLQFDYVLVDECQDLSTAQRMLVLKCHKINTRYVFCGDEKQSIYSFASADFESFQQIKMLPNMKLLPLSISYRCDKNIVKFAQCLTDKIQANPKSGDGEIDFNSSLSDVKDGDMILCRNNAPLMKLYNDLLKMGRKCSIKGKDIGLNLKKIVESTNQEELNLDLSKEGVFLTLYKKLFEKRNEIMLHDKLDVKSANESRLITDRLDQIRALEAISDGINTAEELIHRIERVFSDKKESGISLSTIHKAKGLEADNVYIACRSLMPSKSAVLPWEKKEERNLEYVAYTRAKHKLGFLNEDEFKKYTSNSSDSLKTAEAIVNLHYGIKANPQMINDRVYAEAVMKRASHPKIPMKGRNIQLGNNPLSKTVSPLGILKRNKTKIKI